MAWSPVAVHSAPLLLPPSPPLQPAARAGRADGTLAGRAGAGAGGARHPAAAALELAPSRLTGVTVVVALPVLRRLLRRHAWWRHRATRVGAAAAATAGEDDGSELREGIADFYDASSAVWVEIWGEHMHHGYYEPGFRGNLAQHRRAQVDMIERVLEWAGVPAIGKAGCPMTALDVGCGVGGASRHLQRKYGCSTTGITLSPKQCQQARQLTKASGQAGMCKFEVADALNMPFEDDSFDLVWSLESGEHMPDKQRFTEEMARVCRPGGRLIVVTWVHRDLDEGERLQRKERLLFNLINKAYYLPEWCSIADYASIAKGLSLEGIRTTDWTEKITPFWGAVIRSALKPKGWWALIRGGWRTFRGALVMPLMKLGYGIGTIKFGLLTATLEPSNGARAGEDAAAAGDAAGAGTSTAMAAVAPRCAASRGRSWRGTSARRRLQPSSRLFSRLRRLARGGAGEDATMANSPDHHEVEQAEKREEGRSGRGLRGALLALWDFSRPHTLIGTLISVPSVMIFASMPMLLGVPVAAAVPTHVVFLRMVAAIVAALVPALLVNIFITGLNQIYDVEIDKINKPYLVIPAGRLSPRAAWCIVLTCLAGAVALAHSYPSGMNGIALHATLALSAVLGSSYSAPPIRLKRSPFMAAFCIVVVRGVVVNLGFYFFALRVLAPLGGAAALPLDGRGLLAAGFFAVFGLVIALMKDVPDVLGDEVHGLRSLSVRLGPDRVFRLASGILLGLLGATTLAFGAGSVLAAGVGGALAPWTLSCRLLLTIVAFSSYRFVKVQGEGVDTRDSKSVFNFYMQTWKVFYSSYLCLPLAR